MTHRFGYITPRHHCSQQSAGKLSLRTDDRNPNHHLWNNNGTWFVHYTVSNEGYSGQRYRESLNTHDVREARKLRDQLFARMQGGVL